MRKYLIALTLLAFTFGGGVAYALNPPDNEGTILGTIGRQRGTPVREYKLVRFASTSQAASVQTISVGEVVVYDTVSDDGVTIRRTTTSADGAIAGIAVTAIQSSDSTSATSAQDDEGRRNWGYIIVHGPAVANTGVGGTNAHTAGTPFVTSSDAGMVAGFQNGATTAVTDVMRQVAGKGGFFMDNAGTDSTDPQEDVFVELE